MQLPEYQRAKTVMFYVDVRTEVRTRQALPEALASGKRVVIPYCVDGELELFHLESMDELELGMYRILEPKAELRSVAAKRTPVEELELILVPGVAFDRRADGPGTARDTTTSCLSTHCQPLRSWLWPSSASYSPRFRCRITISTWTRSSPKLQSTRGLAAANALPDCPAC